MTVRKWIISTLGCVAIFSALAAFKVLEIRAAIAYGESFPEHAETVEPATVTATEFTPTIKVIGEMVAPQRLDLRNELAGEITAINFKAGDKIQRGQILMQLDTSVETANLAAAKAAAELAKSVFQRSQNLYQSKATSKDQLDRSKADLSTSLAQVEALKSTINKKTLRAPFDGRAGLHNFEVGQLLTENTLITTLVSEQGFIWVDFKVPQFYRQLPPGTQVQVNPIGDQQNSSPINAEVVAENTIIDPANRSRHYRAKVPDAENRYSANTMVSVQVPVADTLPVLQIPALAIQQDPLGQFVYLLEADENSQGFRASRRQVKVRLIDGANALIDSGLQQGDVVAAAGAFKLHEGLLVYTGERPGLTQE